MRWEGSQSPRALHAIEAAQPQPSLPPSSLSWPRFPILASRVAPLLWAQGPTPSHFPLGSQPSGLLRPGNELAPCPASSPSSDHAHSAGVQVPGSHRAWASRPGRREGHPARPSWTGQVWWGRRAGRNPELGASPGAGRGACSREAAPAWGGVAAPAVVAADAGELPRLCRAQLALPGKWGPSRSGGLAARCGQYTWQCACLPADLISALG